MQDSLCGNELNIYCQSLKIDETLDQDQLYNSLKDILLGFDDIRETYPVGLELSAEVKVRDSGNFLENQVLHDVKDQDYIIIGHYFIYSNAYYEIIGEHTEIDKKDFFEWAVYEYPEADYWSDVLELQTTGESIDEKTFVVFKKGQDIHFFRESILVSLSGDVTELDEDQEEELKSMVQSVFEVLSK
ncbi:hypothetical protein N8600_06995 [Gammaproteobacteria bacterium]|nr:hypothetical protein [Gammaproteobacteria bacterium]